MRRVRKPAPLSLGIGGGEVWGAADFPAECQVLASALVFSWISTNKHSKQKGQIGFSADLRMGEERGKLGVGWGRRGMQEDQKGHAQLGPDQMGNLPAPHPKLTKARR